MMDRKKLRILQLKIVGSALTLMTAAFVANVLSMRPDFQPSLHSALAPAAVAGLGSVGRGPASVPHTLSESAVFPARSNGIVKMDTVAFSCWDEEAAKKIDTSARFVRFTGRGCGKRLKVESWQVQNTSNGFAATIFSNPAQLLTTDYIPLQEGVNEIRFMSSSPEGVRQETVVRVERK